MPKEKKVQHYVPKCYLESWCIPNKNQLHVYDKEIKKQRINHIDDVASERYFYDLDLSGVFSDEEIKDLGLENVDLSKIDEEQYIENYFSDKIEGEYKTLLQSIISKVMSMSAWEVKNCYFINEEDIINLSIFMAIQSIRVKLVRSSIADSADCLEQVLIDMGIPESARKKYCVSEQQLKLIHGKMIFNHKEVTETAHIFANHVWVLLLNKTPQPFYTSDNPIGTIQHIKHPFLSMSGIACKGVEVFFPISPKLMLVMYAREFHLDMIKYHRRIVEIDDINIIKGYNAKSVINSQRCTYSSINDFSVIEDMLICSPNILDKPRSVMSWGGKEYFPRKNN